MADLTIDQFVDEPGRLEWPGILDLSEHRKSDFSGGTPPLMLPHLDIEERVACYFRFLRAWDKREDPLLRDVVQQFSHRLHWDEHPFIDYVRQVDDPFMWMWQTLLFSFTNEKWDTFMALWAGGEDELRARLEDEDYRPARSDLFQIYYPKGTKTRQWLVDGTKKAAREMCYHIVHPNRPMGIMNLAYKMRDYFQEKQGFTNALYPCKNFSRYLAMAFPEIVDPESYVHPGTGSFRGLHQIFGGKYLMSSAKYDVDYTDGSFIALNNDGFILYEQLSFLQNHPDNPVQRQNLINHEDKCCFFAKHLMMHAGIQKPTMNIPYGAMFPTNWSIRTGNYDRVPGGL